MDNKDQKRKLEGSMNKNIMEKKSLKILGKSIKNIKFIFKVIEF